MVDVVFSPDGLSLERAVELCTILKGCQYSNWLAVVKIHDLYDRHGPAAIEPFRKLRFKVWVDYKLHDTPDTVRLRAMALKDAGVSIVTVHASGGIAMMRAAKETGLTVYGVTVLTSLQDDDSDDGVQKVFNRAAKDEVSLLADMAEKAGLDGVVCSALEARSVAGLLSPLVRAKFHIVVPGTRSVGVALGSQRRTATPGEAVSNGATHLVVASEVVKADDPVEAFGKFTEQVETALD